MNDVIELDDHRPIWTHDHVVSKCCKHHWQAVYVIGSKKLQCPICMEMCEFDIIEESNE